MTHTTTEESLRKEWYDSDVCDELKFNIDGIHRNDEVERRQEDVFDFFLQKRREENERLKEFVKSLEQDTQINGKVPLLYVRKGGNQVVTKVLDFIRNNNTR